MAKKAEQEAKVEEGLVLPFHYLDALLHFAGDSNRYSVPGFKVETTAPDFIRLIATDSFRVAVLAIPRHLAQRWLDDAPTFKAHEPWERALPSKDWIIPRPAKLAALRQKKTSRFGCDAFTRVTITADCYAVGVPPSIHPFEPFGADFRFPDWRRVFGYFTAQGETAHCADLLGDSLAGFKAFYASNPNPNKPVSIIPNDAGRQWGFWAFDRETGATLSMVQMPLRLDGADDMPESVKALLGLRSNLNGPPKEEPEAKPKNKKRMSKELWMEATGLVLVPTPDDTDLEAENFDLAEALLG